jgi:hypothetical protein
MSATTVRLDEATLREIRSVKPRDQTLAAYVREAVDRDILRRKLRAAATEYQAFLGEHPEEGEDLAAWERAPLAAPPTRRRK